MTPALTAAGPTNCPAAATEAVVSRVPPSHAPPTISGICNTLMTQGWMISMGMAINNTKVVTYDNFFLSPLMAPAATIAAETPQMDTAEARMIPNSSSTFSFLLSHSEKNQTAVTTITAWTIPGSPAFIRSEDNIVVPRITSPVLI